MKDRIALVGHTGFVGSNLYESYDFDYAVNSKNVQDLYGLRPDVLIYAGVTGTKWYANKYPEYDDQIIKAAKQNIERINPKRLVLISTVDVYNPIDDVDEDTEVDINLLHKYGSNRALLEKWVKNSFVNYNIIRLPAIYGKNLKKNFVYDLIHIVPKTLTPNTMEKVLIEMSDILSFYKLNGDGNYELKFMRDEEYLNLRRRFLDAHFNALNFTNSQSEYQFYNLKNLWKDIQLILDNQIEVINLVTEPIVAKEVYKNVYGKEFVNKEVSPIYYNIKTKYACELIGKDNYIQDKKLVLEDLCQYIFSSIENLKIK